jgi:hypothetical protein
MVQAMLGPGIAAEIDDSDSLDWDDEGFPRVRARGHGRSVAAWLLLLFGAVNIFGAPAGGNAASGAESGSRSGSERDESDESDDVDSDESAVSCSAAWRRACALGWRRAFVGACAALDVNRRAEPCGHTSGRRCAGDIAE